MPSIPIATLAERIELDYRGRDCAESTIKSVKLVFAKLEAVGVRRSADITTEAVARLKLAHAHLSPETVRSYLRTLSAVCTIAAFNGYIRRDPFDLHAVDDWIRKDARRARPARKFYRPPDEIRKMLALATKEAASGGWQAARLEAYVHTLFLTGARPGEVQHILAPNVDRRLHTIKIEPTEVTIKGRAGWWRPKTVGSAATLPIGERLLEVLDRWEARRLVTGRRIVECPWLFPGAKLRGPWTSGGVGVRPLDQVRELGERAGIKDLAQKSARKGVGTDAKTMQLGGLERRALFRHEDVETGDLYDEEAVESLRPAVRKVEAFYLGTGT